MIAARQVAAADRAGEQHVADERDSRALMEEHDMARRMPRAVPHAERRLAHRHGVAVLQPAVRGAGPGIGKSRPPGAASQFVQQEGVVLVRPLDFDPELARQLGRAAGMVEMAMGQKDLFQGHPLQLQGGPESVQIPAGVDKRALLGARTPHQRAILLVGRHRKDRGLDRGRFHSHLR